MFRPNVQDEPRPWLARAVLLGARAVTAMVVGSGALLGSFFENIPDLLRISSPVQHCDDDRAIALNEKINDVIRLLKYRSPDRAILFRKRFGVPGYPANCLFVFLA